jgi:amino acid transporter
MKKIVLTFGLISGAITSLMMLVTLPLIGKVSFDKLEILGYTTMVVSFLMVFFGIRTYRESIGNGKITFGRAFKVGILITLISCVCYVVVWEFIYFKIAPDFADKYGAYLIEETRASGASAEAIAAKTEQIKSFRAMYDNPLMNAAITLMEPLPVGLLITLISAAILRKKEPKTHSPEADPATAHR